MTAEQNRRIESSFDVNSLDCNWRGGSRGVTGTRTGFDSADDTRRARRCNRPPENV